MNNTGKFAGLTAIISGSSRGIGLQIARKLAADGANITVAAKTAEPHPKLPGTIYTAAEEIEKAGGKALPCIMDVRDENSVRETVEATVRKFGGIDIVVNNASALSPTKTEATMMKNYDLMHSLKICRSKHCIPHLRRSKHAHILNISPPLDMKSKWFANHVAYTMAKFGMSMCVLGMSAELQRDGIAVNALWPRTMIYTAAIQNVLAKGNANVKKYCRKPEIMADAAYAALSQPASSLTGQFLIDDTFLAEQGVTDFDVYQYDTSVKPYDDFFVPDSYKNPVSKWIKSKQ